MEAAGAEIPHLCATLISALEFATLDPLEKLLDVIVWAPLWVIFTFAWLAYTAYQLFRFVRASDHEREEAGAVGRRWVCWGIPPAIMLLTVIMVWGDVPFRMKFLFSRGAFQSVVKQVSVSHKVPPGPRHVGLFHIDWVEQDSGSVYFYFQRGTDRPGFIRYDLPGTRPFPEPIELGGGWWAGRITGS